VLVVLFIARYLVSLSLHVFCLSSTSFDCDTTLRSSIVI